MKHLSIGTNEIKFELLRDNIFFQPITNLYCLRCFTHDTKVEKLVLVRDISSHPRSYQTFALTATTGTESLSEAVVSLVPFGQWDLAVYPVTGSTIADVDMSIRLYNGFIYSHQ